MNHIWKNIVFFAALTLAVSVAHSAYRMAAALEKIAEHFSP